MSRTQKLDFGEEAFCRSPDCTVHKLKLAHFGTPFQSPGPKLPNSWDHSSGDANGTPYTILSNCDLISSMVWVRDILTNNHPPRRAAPRCITHAHVHTHICASRFVSSWLRTGVPVCVCARIRVFVNVCITITWDDAGWMIRKGIPESLYSMRFGHTGDTALPLSHRKSM